MIGRSAALLLVIFVGVAPLALGSNRPLPWAYNAFMAGAIAIFCCGLLWSDKKSRVPLNLGTLILPLAFWFMALSWAGFQLLPLPGSNLAHPSWKLAVDALGDGLRGTISVN